MFFKIVYYIMFFITFLYGSYFVITGFIGLIKKRNINDKITNKNNNFAILIAARNEENTIGNLLESLALLDYPKDKYKVYVIPNNCNDNTKDVAIKHGANIIDCNIDVKTKADVLRLAFKELRNENIDAYVIFDADNVVNKNFLLYMNNSDKIYL